MTITLAGVTFDPAQTVVKERHEEVGGRRERTVELTGLILGESSVAAIEAKLDAVLDAASAEDYSAALSVRPGRRLWVRREAFTRQVEPSTLAGSFTLKLKAKSPFEEAETPVSQVWTITHSGETIVLASGGNVYAAPVITLTASGSLVDPAISDGTRTIQYGGIVGDAQTLTIDASAGTVWLDDEDVTPYTSGEFPRTEPEGTTLTYTDGPGSSHTAAGAVEYRNRWW
jgi:hypothetical protein